MTPESPNQPPIVDYATPAPSANEDERRKRIDATMSGAAMGCCLAFGSIMLPLPLSVLIAAPAWLVIFVWNDPGFRVPLTSLQLLLLFCLTVIHYALYGCLFNQARRHPYLLVAAIGVHIGSIVAIML